MHNMTSFSIIILSFNLKYSDVKNAKTSTSGSNIFPVISSNYHCGVYEEFQQKNNNSFPHRFTPRDKQTNNSADKNSNANVWIFSRNDDPFPRQQEKYCWWRLDNSLPLWPSNIITTGIPLFVQDNDSGWLLINFIQSGQLQQRIISSPQIG